MSAKWIPISTWASRLFDPVPSERTLRRWIHNGNILPRPTKVGQWRVLETARYIDVHDPNYLENVEAAKHESAA